MKCAIVTGASGFIGTNLVIHLVEAGYFVYAISRSALSLPGHYSSCGQIQPLFVEMKDYGRLPQLMPGINAEIIYHFSWAGVSDATSSDVPVQLDNVMYSCDLLRSAATLGIRRFVFAGSIMEYEHIKSFESGMYGVPPRSIYHVAKNTARNMTQILANSTGIEFIPLTISNIYGPGDKSLRFINKLMLSAINNEPIQLTSCEQKYDFFYIDDAVRAIVLAGEKGLKNKSYFIGNKYPRVLKEYVLELLGLYGKQDLALFGALESKSVSLEYNEFDTMALYDNLGFVAKTGFVPGIVKLREWITKDNPHFLLLKERGDLNERS